VICSFHHDHPNRTSLVPCSCSLFAPSPPATPPLPAATQTQHADATLHMLDLLAQASSVQGQALAAGAETGPERSHFPPPKRPRTEPQAMAKPPKHPNRSARRGAAPAAPSPSVRAADTVLPPPAAAATAFLPSPSPVPATPRSVRGLRLLANANMGQRGRSAPLLPSSSTVGTGARDELALKRQARSACNIHTYEWEWPPPESMSGSSSALRSASTKTLWRRQRDSVLGAGSEGMVLVFERRDYPPASASAIPPAAAASAGAPPPAAQRHPPLCHRQLMCVKLFVAQPHEPHFSS
jgi:hypothetical protein